MNLTKYAALLPALPKVIQVLSDGEIAAVAEMILPERGAALAQVLTETKGMPVSMGLKHILDAPVVSDFVKARVAETNQATEEAARTVFVRCPQCMFAFETQLVED